MLLQGAGEPILIDPSSPAKIIGECINPSGKNQLLRALFERDWDYLASEAARQVEAGADVIDVNVGGKGIDEVAVLPEVVKVVADAVDVPLSIDTRNPAALEAALAICPGRPLINSIGGEKEVLTKNLPVVVDHQMPFIALCMGDDGVPPDAEGRLKVAHFVLNAAVQSGVKEEDVIFDPLVMTVGADHQAARVVLEATRLLRRNFPKNNITGGASNVSFGMPSRTILNANFLTVASVAGMNFPITDPTQPDLRMALLAADVFLGRDRNSRRYMRYYRQTFE